MPGAFGNPPPGLIFNVDGHFCFWRGLSVTEGPRSLPIWTVDVDGHAASSGSLESALLMAGRAATARSKDE